MPKFTSIPIEVEAYQVPPADGITPETFRWLAGFGFLVRVPRYRHVADIEITRLDALPIYANRGDWLVHSAQGLTVCADAEFHAGFRRAEG